MSRLAPLRSLADHLAHGAPLPERHREAALEALACVLGGEASLDEAFGLKPGPGQRSAQTTAILAERDHHLRAAAAEFYPGLPPAHQARELHARWTHYRASGWHHERALDAAPLFRAGTLQARLWAVLRLRDFVPSERTLRAVLATSSGCSLPPPSPTLALDVPPDEEP